jgi:heparosan-N-sulfate-glucuronate 5-epimerase
MQPLLSASMIGETSAPRRSRRRHAGFFSSAATFHLPIGEQFDAQTVGGYYIDMRVKAETPVWPEVPHWLYVVVAQSGLGCFERYLAGEGEVWLAAATERANHLMQDQHRDGPQAGGFLHRQPLPHTFALRPPWISAMAQGEGASLLVRIFQETGDERYAEAARRALLPLSVDAVAGGVRTLLDGRPFPEEYPTQPPSLVLNGAMFTSWGLHDVGVGLNDQSARTAFEQAVDTLAENLHRWDLGYWSRYDLYPHPVVNVASSFYHDLHINQLRAMHRLSPRPQFAETAERWQRYARSSRCRARGFAGKALFRLLVPRNKLFAQRLPWSSLRKT